MIRERSGDAKILTRIGYDHYARLSARERTLLWLTKATDLHEDEPLMMMTHLFDFLRPDQEFIAIEKRVGFVR